MAESLVDGSVRQNVYEAVIHILKLSRDVSSLRSSLRFLLLLSKSIEARRTRAVRIEVAGGGGGGGCACVGGCYIRFACMRLHIGVQVTL